jgi:ectoine hydroxylase-related dioxygenase (phytanoyl-CoA dioxygenase family)
MAHYLTKRTVFSNPILQESFNSRGYIVIPKFLMEVEIEFLTDLYSNNSPNVDTAFHVTNWGRNNEFREIIHQGVTSALAEKLKNILNQYKPVLGCFAVKKPNQDNKMGLHQDWSIVEEKTFDGISIWVPLIDVSENTGALKILEGSHQLFGNIRGQKIYNQLDDLSVSIINSYLTAIPMKAGDMLILHHRLVHCSEATENNTERIAAMLAMVPNEAEVKHYLAQKEYAVTKDIRVFNCPNDFYVHFDIESEPTNAVEITGTYQNKSFVTNQMIIDFYQK